MWTEDVGHPGAPGTLRAKAECSSVGESAQSMCGRKVGLSGHVAA